MSELEAIDKTLKKALTGAQRDIADEILQMAEVGSDSVRKGRDGAPLTRGVLVGHAGTGKTTVIAHVVNQLVERYDSEHGRRDIERAGKIYGNDSDLTHLERQKMRSLGAAGLPETDRRRIISRRLARSGIDGYRSIVVSAPTHKALSVLRGKLADHPLVTYATVQSLVGLKMNEHDDGYLVSTLGESEPRLGEYGIAIIDECSMVDDELLAVLLAAPGDCRLVFVGDDAQLPPVSKSAGELSSTFDPKVSQITWRLNDIHRQARENPIIRVAESARDCIHANRPFGSREIAEALGQHDGKHIQMTHGDSMSCARLLADARGHGLDCYALAYTNKAVDLINRFTHAQLGHKADEPAVGEPFMVYEPTDMEELDTGELVQLRNSDLLRVVSVEVTDPPENEHGDRRPTYKLLVHHQATGREGFIYIPVDVVGWRRDVSEAFAEGRRLKGKVSPDSYREWIETAWALKRRYASVRMGYAMTVHKSQGSTFDAAIIDWRSFAKCRVEQDKARLAYVAVTRTSKYCVVVV